MMHLLNHKMVILMINKIFEEIKKEARNNEVSIMLDGYDTVVRMQFNIVDDKVYDMPNFYIKNRYEFYDNLNKYVYSALEFYELEPTEENIKMILTYIWANITPTEMKCIEKYIEKYICFISDNTLKISSGYEKTNIGNLHFNVLKQSIMQETPYCFKSYFENDDGSKFSLPRISFGIKDNICYIYAIQNKDSKINIDAKYNLLVKDSIRSINSGVKKYRNVSPSFIISLSLFISFLKHNNISKVKVETPLEIRINNRKSVADYKIKFYSAKGTLSPETLDDFKKEINLKRLNDDYNSTIKFINCFNRLKVHFDNIFMDENDINNDIILEVMNLITNNSFLKSIVDDKNFYYIEKERYNGKIS